MQSLLSYSHIDSPVGKLMLVASARGLRGLWFESDKCALYASRMLAEGSMEEKSSPLLKQARTQLEEYFAGKRKEFKLPIDMQGTMFQIQAWRQLQKIPYGQTISYGQQAARMGDSNKARAAGVANGRNPIAIIVPCHRVIGSNGSLTGFAGGLDTKQYLLELEQQHCN